MKKNVDPMTKKPIGSTGGGHDMPGAHKVDRVKNSTSNNPAAKRDATVKGTPKNNARFKHSARVPRY